MSQLQETSIAGSVSTEYVQAEEFRKFLEMEVLNVIKDISQDPETSQDKIQEIARYVLEHINPTMNLQELYLSGIKLDDVFPELAPVTYKVMKQYEEKYEKKALTEVSNLVRDRKYDEAQEVVKKVLMFKIS